MKSKYKSFGLREAVSLYFRKAPLITSAMYLLKLLFALLPFLTVLVSARFVDGVLAFSEKDRGAVISSAFLVAVLMLIQQTGSNLYSFLRTKQWSRVYPVTDRMITEKISLLPYEKAENDAIQDILSRVRTDPEGLLWGILEGYMGLGGFLISNVSLVAVLVTQAPVWVSAVVSGMLILFGIFAVRGGEKQYNAWAEVTLRRRKAKYYGEILSNRAMADERMLFRYGDTVNEMFRKESREARLLERKARRWWFLGMNLGAYISIGISVTVILVMMTPVLQGKTSVGLFVSLVTAFMNMTRTISWQFPSLLKEISRGRRLLKDFDTVMGMPDDTEASSSLTESAGCAVAFQTLEFRNVSFRYPGTEKEVLKGISFRMEKGKHYAFAGKNGCGKSTVVKLLLRLYEPDGGEILINGRNIREYDKEQVWDMFAVLFQDYARYPLTVSENIALGIRGIIPEREEVFRKEGASEEEKREVLRAASAAGLDDLIQKLPRGLDTELGKLSENSLDLSGGEWQRVAMARVNCGTSAVRILDEPTAAMDPVQEQKVYRQFSDMNRDATTIMITHRLGATRLSDCIFVIEDGRVMEQGSHSDLMEKQGIYREMYEKQREWYL